MYLVAARESSFKVRLQYGKEASERTSKLYNKSCSNFLKLRTLALIAAMAYTELQIINNSHEHTTNQAMLYKPIVRSSTPLELGMGNKSKVFWLDMGTEFSSDIAGDGPRKRRFDEDEYNPNLEKSKKRKIWNARRSKLTIKRENAKRSKDD